MHPRLQISTLKIIIANMGYNPKDYQELFPLGLFEFEKKPITTWFDSHRLFTLNTVPLKSEEKVLAPGLKVKRGHIKQKGGFSNFMIFEIDPEKRKVDIELPGDKMYYPLEVFEKLKNAKLVTNAGYFYLTDDEKRDPVAPPKVRTGNMVIESGRLINLPILNRSSIVVSKDGRVNMYFLKAKGKLLLNGEEHDWVGSKAREKNGGSFVIYNSSNIEIPVINDPVMGPSRVAKKTFIKPKNNCILAVCKRSADKFIIIKIDKGNILINDKDMVVQIPERVKVSLGDTLNFISIDNLKLKEVKVAVSAGPMLFHSYEKTKKQVKKEFSVSDMANPNNPHEETKKLSRGCLVKLKDGKLCSVLVDGIPQAGDIYQGVTLKEFVNFVNSRCPGFESAIATDPSSSVKVVFRENGKPVVFGNLHYLAHKKDKKGKLSFWPNGRLGRKLNSALVVY